MNPANSSALEACTGQQEHLADDLAFADLVAPAFDATIFGATCRSGRAVVRITKVAHGGVLPFAGAGLRSPRPAKASRNAEATLTSGTGPHLLWK